MYLLDTHICIYFINTRPQRVLRKFIELSPAEIKLSAVSIAEMEYGAAKSGRYEKNRSALVNFAASFDVLPFEEGDAEVFGILKAELEKRGQAAGPYDLQIAAQALRRGLVLVSTDTRKFQGINALRVEDWALPLRKKK
jgi:tRNA(fMet)-specific endonuclease VapC